MKKLWGAALVVAAFCACSGDSSNSVTGVGATSSTHPSASGSSTNYANGSSRSSTSVGGGSTVDTCGCTSTEECCLMGGSSNTFGCVPKGTCTTGTAGTDSGTPGTDSGTTQVDSGGNPPPCTGTVDCPGQVCCATTNGGPASAVCRAACGNNRVQVCTDVNDCPQGDSCNRVGFGQNAVMECVTPPPPMDAGVDAARPDAAAGPDAAADAAAHDAATSDAAPHDAATGG
jgi:hypothetical protein